MSSITITSKADLVEGVCELDEQLTLRGYTPYENYDDILASTTKTKIARIKHTSVVENFWKLYTNDEGKYIYLPDSEFFAASIRILDYESVEKCVLWMDFLSTMLESDYIYNHPVLYRLRRNDIIAFNNSTGGRLPSLEK